LRSDVYEGPQRKKITFQVLIGPIIFGLAACQTIQPPVLRNSSQPAQLYSGRIFIQSENEKQTGNVELLLQDDGVRLRVLAPVIGSRIWELQANDSQILMYDYRDQSSTLQLNSSEFWEEFLGVDVKLGEIKDLLQQPAKVSFLEVLKQDEDQRAVKLVRRDKILGNLLSIEINRWQEGQAGLFPQKMKFEDHLSGNKFTLVFRARQEIFGEPIVFEEPPKLIPSN
tara:strand:+ start:484 stop:1161 length:678 start_codon:yes stop_codon:yes gene_type:complete